MPLSCFGRLQNEHCGYPSPRNLDVMTSELSGEILLCVRKMLAGERDESGDVDEGAAEEAAEALYAAGEKNWFGRSPRPLAGVASLGGRLLRSTPRRT